MAFVSAMFWHCADQPNFTYRNFYTQLPLFAFNCFKPTSQCIDFSNLKYCSSLLIGMTKGNLHNYINYNWFKTL